MTAFGPGRTAPTLLSLVGVDFLLLVMGATLQDRDLHRLQLLGLGYFCTGVGVSVSGYYAWLTRPPSDRSIRHAWLTDLVTTIHADSHQV